MPVPATRPWHVRPMGILALLWQGVLALDYLVLRFGSELGFLPDLGRWSAWFAGQPFWFVTLWAVAVWIGLLAALLLVMAERGAVLAFALAFLAMLAAFIGSLVPGSDVVLPLLVGVESVWLLSGAVVIQFGLWIYARWLKIRGALD